MARRADLRYFVADASLTISQPPRGNNVEYAWAQTGGTSVDLTGADTTTRGLNTPATAGDPEFTLTVTGVGGVGRLCLADTRPDIVRVRVYEEAACSGDSCSDDLRLVDGSDSADSRLGRCCYDDRAWT